MHKKPFDYAVFIGKFAPIHDGHVSVIRQALEKANKVIVVLGQCYEARNTRMPFDEQERITMIQWATNNDPRVIITCSENFLYNDARWIASIQNAVVGSIRHDGNEPHKMKIALAGMAKDSTSYYLNIFPQWNYDIKCDPLEIMGGIDMVPLSSTQLREWMFEKQFYKLRPFMHGRVVDYISSNFELLTEKWERVISDYNYEKEYPKKYGNGPFLTVDSCVTQAGHILLINRGREYGKCLFALPGGFLNPREKLLDGAIRELKEETVIKLPEEVLRGSIKSVKTYDDPYRSNRARLVTTCFRIDLKAVGKHLPKVKGSDDAMKADWYPISVMVANKDIWFEDHWHIVTDILGL